MATVGDKEIFAIEWAATWKSDDGYQYANFCFWVNGHRIGDFEDEIILSSTLSYLEEFLGNFLKRTINDLCGRSKEDIFNYIYDSTMLTSPPGEKHYESLASSRTERIDDCSHLSELRDNFHLDDVGGASFIDRYNVILFNDRSMKSQRMIWRNLKDMSLHEFSLPEKYFDEVSKIFLYEAKIGTGRTINSYK